MTPDAIAQRALQAVGTPFRLYGRKAGVALDCVGLVLHSTGLPDSGARYGLKGGVIILRIPKTVAALGKGVLSEQL